MNLRSPESQMLARQLAEFEEMCDKMIHTVLLNKDINDREALLITNFLNELCVEFDTGAFPFTSAKCFKRVVDCRISLSEITDDIGTMQYNPIKYSKALSTAKIVLRKMVAFAQKVYELDYEKELAKIQLSAKRADADLEQSQKLQSPDEMLAEFVREVEKINAAKKAAPPTEQQSVGLFRKKLHADGDTKTDSNPRATTSI